MGNMTPENDNAPITVDDELAEVDRRLYEVLLQEATNVTKGSQHDT
jgi:hypothetical protein